MTRSRRRKLNRLQALKRHPLVRTGIPVASTLLATFPWTFAQAQDASSTVSLEEVVVTAQKRVENLQNVPIAVQVLDNTKLEQLHIVDVDDYVKFSPSIAYSRGNGQGGSGAPGQSLIYIRGVNNGGDGNHSGSQPSVGTYLDEQPVTTIDGTPEIHLYDIQRMEVLKGPQGTLYGASSEAGTVRIITNKPDTTKFYGNVTVSGNSVESGGLGWGIEGFVNIPLSDNAAIRLVGWQQHDAGFIDSIMGTSAVGCISNGIRTFPTWSGNSSNSPGCPPVGVVGAGAISAAPWTKKNFNTVDTRGGRAALKLNLGEDWTVMPIVMGQRVKTQGFFGYDPSVGDLDIVRFGPDSTYDNWYQTALTVEGKISDFDVVYSGGFMKRTGHTTAEYSDYSLFYDRLFGSGAYWTGNDGNPIMGQEFVNGDGYFEKWSQELRVSTPQKYPVRATVGAFLQRQLHNIWQNYTMPGYGWVSSTGGPGNPNGFSDYYSIPNLPNTIWLTAEQRVDRDRAVFAQIDWDITDQLTLTGGFRQYWFDNTLAGFFGYSKHFSPSGSGMSKCFQPVYIVAKYSPCTNLNTGSAGHGNVPKVTATFKFTPDKMVYATWSKGFRPGGANRIAGPNGKPYESDFLKNYEIGWKTTWADNRLRWNGALFWEDWKNFQFGFLVPPSITAITNAGNARIRGVESEITFAATRQLTLSAGFTWLKATISQNFCAVVGVTNCPNDSVSAPFLPPTFSYNGPLATAGTDLPQVPKFKGNVIARYEFPEVTGWQPYGQVSFVYQNKTAPKLKGNEQAVIGFQPAYGLLDLSGGAKYNGLEISAYISNVANRRAQLTRFTNISSNNDNQVYIVPTQPRTFGLKVSKNF